MGIFRIKLAASIGSMANKTQLPLLVWILLRRGKFMKGKNRLFRFLRNLNQPDVQATALQKQESDPRSTNTPTPGQAEMSGKVFRKILVVDDDLIIQRTVQSALEKKGYQVLIAGDISMALGQVRKEKPDLILLDLTFPLGGPSDALGPLHDGFFVIEWLRYATGSKKIPIIIISGTSPKEYKSHIISAGVVDCFQKPLDHVALLAAIDGTLSRGRWNSVAR